jgi:hypothetical protein
LKYYRKYRKYGIVDESNILLRLHLPWGWNLIWWVGSVQYYRHQWNQKLISNALADAPSVGFDAAHPFYSLSNEAAGAICGFVDAPPFTMAANTMDGKTSKH